MERCARAVQLVIRAAETALSRRAVDAAHART